MAKTRTNLFTDLATLPWPFGFVAGIAGFMAIRYGFAWWMGSGGDAVSQAFAQHGGAAFAPLAWVVLALFWFAALASWRVGEGASNCSTLALDWTAWLRWAGASSSCWWVKHFVDRVMRWRKPAWVAPTAASS